ncbi:MAG: hypothetical protein EAZ85_02900 [Bacteroidetes bacterium]|nr:MAG: hypothetical protein EAZ85_02900 [Bacteroidota bacterium]TAG85584.1 MAG: hypothetical protein EAZ20_14755 [Bacteroidota bacterium]
MGKYFWVIAISFLQNMFIFQLLDNSKKIIFYKIHKTNLSKYYFFNNLVLLFSFNISFIITNLIFIFLPFKYENMNILSDILFYNSTLLGFISIGNFLRHSDIFTLKQSFLVSILYKILFQIFALILFFILSLSQFNIFYTFISFFACIFIWIIQILVHKKIDYFKHLI